MKKLFVLLFLGLFLISFASATEIYWTQVGNNLSTGITLSPAIASLNSTRIVFMSGTTTQQIKTYDWNGTDWNLKNTGSDLVSIGTIVIASLNSTRITFYGNTDGLLRTYDWNGTDWNQVGTSLFIQPASGIASITSLNSTRIAFIHGNNDLLRTYDWNGTDWNQVGNNRSVGSAADPSITSLNSTRIAFIDSANDQLRTYDWNGTDWSQSGNSLAIIETTRPSITSLSSTRIAFIDFGNKQLRTYDWNGTDWSQTGDSLSIINCGNPSITKLTSTEIAFVDGTNRQLRTYDWDDTAPAISLNYPTALIDYGKINGTLQLNFTATDTNLDKVWYNYNGTNVTIAGAVSGVYNISNITLSTKKNVTIYANDTVGNIKAEVFGWDYRYFETNTSFNTPVLATSSQTFRLIGEKHSTVTGLTARLFYNGVATASIVSTSGNNVNFTNSFEIPAGTATRNFFWEITATTTNGTVIFNTSTQTQTVQNITFTTCTTPTGLAYNFTTYDTETNLPLNSTFEATFSYYAAGGSGQVLAEYNYQNLSENRSNYLFCLNSSGLNVTIDAFISYGATGYDSRDYIIDDGTIGNFTVTIPLFLTQTLLTDVVTFTLEDQNYDRISGALVTVQKWNVGTNTYSTIGMFTTSSSGTGIMDLELYNTWYRAIVTINGVIVHVTDIQKLGSTDWPITINLGIQNPYDLFGTISQGLEYDNITQIVTYSWADSSGYVNTACLTVRRPSGSGYTILYNDCVDTVAGSINYQFLLNGTYEVYGTVYLTAEYGNISQVGDFMTITIGTPEITQVSSPYGKVISFIIIGTSGLVGVSLGSPILGIFLLIGGMWGASMMGWLKGIEAIIWGIITVAIVILARQSRRGS